MSIIRNKNEKNVKCNTRNKSHKHYGKSDTQDCHSKEGLTKMAAGGSVVVRALDWEGGPRGGMQKHF